MMTKWFLMMFLLVGLISCKTTKMDELDDGKKILSMSKGACFGDCPVYTVSVSSNGLMDMYVSRFSKDNEWKGNYMKQMTKSQFSKFARLYAKVKTSELDNVYDRDLMDLPQTTFVFHGDNDKISKYKFSAPKELQDLSEYIHTLVDDEKGWNQYVKDTADGSVEQVDILKKDKHKFVVKLNKEVDLYNWLKKYSFHNMDVERVLSQSENIYLLNFKSTMSVHRISEELRRDKDVITMEVYPAPKKGKGNQHGEIKIRTDKKGNK